MIEELFEQNMKYSENKGKKKNKTKSLFLEWSQDQYIPGPDSNFYDPGKGPSTYHDDSLDGPIIKVIYGNGIVEMGNGDFKEGMRKFHSLLSGISNEYGLPYYRKMCMIDATSIFIDKKKFNELCNKLDKVAREAGGRLETYSSSYIRSFSNI